MQNILIIWLVTSCANVACEKIGPPPSYEGSINSVKFNSKLTCEAALSAVTIKARGKIQGVCSPL
jgi:hypothetical protein